MTTTFLILSFLFPRLTLLGYWLAGWMPLNSTPFALDVLCGLSLPHFLIALWVYETPGLHWGWAVAHVVIGLAKMLRAGRSSWTTADERRKGAA